MPSTHKKDKPWDTDDIDKWKVEAFTPNDNAGGTFAEESSFMVRYLQDQTSPARLNPANPDHRRLFSPSIEKYT